MIAVVTIVLWLVVLTLGLYAVLSDKGSGDLPPIPANAESLSLLGTEYSICVPSPGAGNVGLEGTGDAAMGYVVAGDSFPAKTYGLFTPPFADEGCVNVGGTTVQFTYNTMMAEDETNYLLISNTKTLQQLIDHYFPASGGWTENV
jgi:hypothetical protein